MAARHLGMSENRRVKLVEESEARRWDHQAETRQRMLGEMMGCDFARAAEKAVPGVIER